MTTPHKRIEKQSCPRCGYAVDSVSPSRSFQMPEPGDITLCMKCAFVMQLDANMHLVPADLSKLSTEQVNDIIHVGRTIRSWSPGYFAKKN